MNTILIWLLVSLPSTHSYAPPTTVAERFATAEECERVANVLRSTPNVNIGLLLRCVQAKVVVVK